ncbi:MAG: triose-phosphate isomerase family protein, partial [Gaiellales bacterium]
MTGRPLVGAGLKMFLGYAETIGYLRELAASAAEFDGVEVFVLPSFPVLAAARDLLAGSAVRYGAQDAHWEESGAYTGCVSPAVLRELGCTFVEVGHAERRRLFGESDDMVARKALAAVRCGLEPIVCVGEAHESDGAAASIVGGQAAAVL